MSNFKVKLVAHDRSARKPPVIHFHKSHEQLVKEVAILEQRVNMLVNMIALLYDTLEGQSGLKT